VASSLTKLPVHELMIAALPFVAVLIVALAIITFVPAVSLLLL
jgi:TRAP-type C4-dicarboxylate transport system permease large subunit